MTKEEKVAQEERRSPCGDPAFVRQMQDMMEKGDIDCAKIMSRMMAKCCGSAAEPTALSDSPENENQEK
jgi:hypothetical protein